MALVLKDRVKETSTTAGTGTITLAGAVAGFQSFAAVGNGNTTYYAIVDPTTGDWEVGIGTYTSSGTTLSRTTVLSSSNSGSLVNFVANQKDVFVTYPSEKSVYEDASNVVNATSFGAITATSAALTTGTVSTAPASGTDIANKTYVDTLVSSGITYHTPVKYEVPDSTGNLNATYNQPGGPGVGVGATLTNAGTLVAFTPDGTVATAGDRIIIYNQTNQFENGIYTVTTVGSGSVAWVLTRATDADTYALKSPNGLGNGDAFFITSGATGAGETYVCNTAGTITFGTTAITFAQISDSTLYTAGTGLTLSGTEFSITPTGTAGTYGSASSVPVLTTNASGQVTSVTNTTIAINGSQVSGNISGSAGSVANSLTLGTYLTGGTYNGSAAVTATVDATSANTASKVVARDSNGDFSAGTITATLNGTATSTASATNLSGGAANQIAYQSATNTTAFATAPSASNQVLNWNGSAFTWSAGTISGVPLGSNLNSLTAGTYLTGTAYNGSAAQTWTVDATSANTASKVVARDASGNFSAGTITASLSGNATSATNSTTTSQRAFSGDISTTGQGRFTGWYSGNAATGFAVEAGISGGEGYVIAYDRTTSTYGALNIQTSSASLRLSGSTVNVSTGALQQGGSQVLTAANYNSYAPTLTGTGASGTWSINVTGSSGSTSGNAATASRVTGGNLNPASTAFNNALISASGSNRVVTFDGNGTTPSVWWSNGSRAYGAIDAQDPGLTFWANNGSSWQQQMAVNYGNVTINTDIRSPIFYDSNDTGYYVDPNSTSRQYQINFNYLYYAGDTNYGFLGSSVYVDTINSGYAGDQLELNYYRGTFVSISHDSMRAPLFYDYDNTSFYLDPASSSVLNTIYQAGVYTRNAAGTGYLSGNYSSSETSSTTGAIYTIGGSYYPTSTSFNTMYGIGYCYAPNISVGISGAGGWGLYVNGSGINNVWLGGETGQVISTSEHRGTIFYDYSNTGYYVDPASSSNMYEVYANNWFRTYGVTGLYSQSYASHFYPQSNGRYWSITGNGSTDYGALVFKINYESTIKGYVYWDTSGFGLLHGSGGWSVRGNLGAVGGQFYGSWFSDTDLRAPIFYDSNDTAYYVDPNSVSSQSSILIGYNSASSAVYTIPSTGYLTFGSTSDPTNYSIKTVLENYNGNYSKLSLYWYTGIRYYASNYYGGHRFYDIDGTQYFGIGVGSGANWSYSIYSHRAPIFYDLDNTGYYVDPASTSNLNLLNVNSSGRYYADNYFYSYINTTGSGPGLQAFSSGGQGAVMAFHRGGYYAVNMGLDSDNVFRLGGWSASANLLQINMSGNLTMLANITAYSDERLKKDWADLPSDFVPRLARVKSGTYTRIDNEMRQIGVGAQSLRPLMEEAVFENADGTLSVAYGNAAMASSVELAKYVTALEQRISQLEARI